MASQTPEELLEIFRQDLISIDKLNPDHEICARCQRVAIGLATLHGKRYCHGRAKQPSCYDKAVRDDV